MPNSYFQFKQFIVQQDKCAMKVTTDGCLFGAIVAKELREKGTCRVLDIGTGTSLLSLMVAQQNKAAVIDAIEIDEAAAIQAKENVAASPWNERINIFQGDILKDELPFQYDFIISNPPFYEQQLSSPDEGRKRAHHSSGLTLQQLVLQVQKMLKLSGNFYVLLPFYRAEEAVTIAGKVSLSSEKQWRISQTNKHSFFRAVFSFSYNKSESINVSEITIRNGLDSYTQAFTELLQPYYVKL